MAITEKDLKYMKEVAEYYNKSASDNQVGSIRDTALHFNLSRNKVRKILVTMGVLDSPITNDALILQSQGMTIKEIAKELGVSVATVSISLPYEKKYDNSLDPSPHAVEVRGYRAYEKSHKERQAKIVPIRNNPVEIDDVVEDTSSSNNRKMLRLHMELYSDYYDEDTINTFRKYGDLKHGDNISRDVLVPADIPLYALHYVIQRAFGWQNSHLHQFELPYERFVSLCDNNASMWRNMVGILFRSPLMDEYDEFWTDDYNGGSFKNWLRSKYTGPYISLCHGEGLIPCYEDMMSIDPYEEYYVLYEKSSLYEDGKKEFLTEVRSVYDYYGKRVVPPKPWREGSIYRVETVRFKEIPVEGLRYLFERNEKALLERLPLNTVLAVGESVPLDFCSDEEIEHIENQIIKTGSEMKFFTQKKVYEILEDDIDLPDRQVTVAPFTDVLLYNYDFGDNWKIKITGSEGCDDLLKPGRITNKVLKKALDKCQELYRPVLIAKDGDMLIDDVGGIRGFADFLESINPDFAALFPEERDEAKREMEESLSWAEYLGWHREKISDFNLL